MSELHGYAVPIVSADSDDGFGVGLRGELSRSAEGYAPYRWALMAQTNVTTTGYQHHRVRFDHLWPHARFTGNVAYRKWLNSQWYGLGNDARRAPTDDPKRERYVLVQPFARFTLRFDLHGPLQGFVAADFDVTTIGLYDDSRLGDESPRGLDGGPQVEALAGLIYDTREPEISPEHGVFLEASGRFGARLPTIEPRGEMYGGMVVARGYERIAPGVILAGRVMAEHLAGDVPFYEMTHWGGSLPIVGVGGADTLRGLPFDRYHGPGHAVANVELRTRVASVTVAKAPLELGVTPAIDAAAVWGSPSDTGFPVPHPALVLGGRAIYDATFVGRADFGVAPDRRIVDGDRDEAFASWGFYLAFDHTF